LNLHLDLGKIKEYLDNLENAREDMLKRGRDVLNLCRALISRVVRGEDATEYVGLLQEMYNELYNSVAKYPELFFSNTFFSIAIEYVEALQLYSIIKESKIVALDEIKVHPIPYILGLVEVIGELKRISLEDLRRDRFSDANRLLETAEELYNKISQFSYPDAMLPGFRRKLDIYRKVLEDWKKFLVDMESRKSLIQRLNEMMESFGLNTKQNR